MKPLSLFLKDAGFQEFKSEVTWLNAIKKELGPSRFKRFEEQVKAVQTGLLEGRNLYDTLYKEIEFHLVLSRHVDRILTCYEAIILQVNHQFSKSSPIIDLGCSTGVLLDYLEQGYEFKGIGVDTSGNALMIAAERNSQLNFVLWDYQKSTTQELNSVQQAICVFGVDFESLPQLQPEAINSYAPYLSEDSQLHKMRLEEALGIWENWSSIFVSNSQMIQVLRLAWFDHFVAWIRAAEENDWILVHIEWVENQERFPLMTWEYQSIKAGVLTQLSTLKDFWDREI